MRIFKFYEDQACTIPANITGRDFRAAIVNQKTGKEVIAAAIGDKLTIQNGNELKWLITAEEMKIPAEVYLYDIEQRISVDDFHFTIIEGEFKLDKDYKQWNS